MTTPSKAAATRRAKLGRKCKNFTGIGDKQCRIGVAYDHVRDESVRPFRWPCCDADAITTCPGRALPTDAEVDEQMEAMSRWLNNMVVARTAIVASGLRSGAIDCPVCGKAGTLRFSVASCNGHIHASCPGCVSWVE